MSRAVRHHQDDDDMPIVVLDRAADVTALPEAHTTGVHHDHDHPSRAGPAGSQRTAPAAAPVGGAPPGPGRRALPPPAAGSGAPDRRAVVSQVTALAPLDLDQLRGEWRRLYGTDPPGLGRDLLRRRLAYRVQELAYGGLSPATRERLRQIEAAASAKPKPRTDGTPAIGTLLVREYLGVRHEVTVQGDGFAYQGRPWRSLSAIAKAITGGHCDGPRFFGLRQRVRGGAA